MPKKRTISEEQVRERRKAGMDAEEIAADLKCSISQVKKIMAEGDYIYRGFYSSALYRRPILQVQIDKLRESTPIGQVIWIEDDDPLWAKGNKKKKFRVAEKYRYFCLLTDGRKKVTKTWLEMILEKRGEQT